MPVTSRTYALSPAQIGAVILRDDWTCAYCLRRLEWAGIVFDHVIPRCDGGSDRPPNRVVCCHSCNVNKGSDPVPEDAVVEVTRRLSASLDLVAGQALAERYYGPWAAQRRANQAAKDRRRRARQRELRSIAPPGAAFPFGANAEAP